MALSVTARRRLAVALMNRNAAAEVANAIDAGASASAVAAVAAIADLALTATTGVLPTPNSSTTVADAATPTVAELLDAVVELKTKQNAVLAALRTHGIVATA